MHMAYTEGLVTLDYRGAIAWHYTISPIFRMSPRPSEPVIRG